jgi:hypothetical protein
LSRRLASADLPGFQPVLSRRIDRRVLHSWLRVLSDRVPTGLLPGKYPELLSGRGGAGVLPGGLCLLSGRVWSVPPEWELDVLSERVRRVQLPGWRHMLSGRIGTGVLRHEQRVLSCPP